MKIEKRRIIRIQINISRVRETLISSLFIFVYKSNFILVIKFVNFDSIKLFFSEVNNIIKFKCVNNKYYFENR